MPLVRVLRVMCAVQVRLLIHSWLSMCCCLLRGSHGRDFGKSARNIRRQAVCPALEAEIDALAAHGLWPGSRPMYRLIT